MAVVIEMHDAGNVALRAEIGALVEHALCERVGDWRVSIIGSRGSDNCEMKPEGLMALSGYICWSGAPASTDLMSSVPSW